MKAEDVVGQLQAVLPTVTDLFSDTVSVTSLTRVGTTVTAVTSSVHGLSVGNEVSISGAKTPLTISTLTFLDGVATAVTASNHDLTEGFENGIGNDSPNVEVEGATEAEYNGSNPLLSVLNRKTFTYSVTGTPSSPATGSPKLLEQFASGYNGRHTVATVPDTTSFTYEITETPESPASGTILVHKGVRASRSINIERTLEAYTEKGIDELWLFVVLGDPVASKDRDVESDATAVTGSGTEYRQRIIMPFSIFCFIPATSEIVGAGARDQIEDIRPLILKSVVGAIFSTGLQSQTIYKTIYEGDFFNLYNGAVYIHQFDFSASIDLVNEDAVNPDFNVAFRDVSLKFLDEFDVEELTANVDLDDQPLP